MMHLAKMMGWIAAAALTACAVPSGQNAGSDQVIASSTVESNVAEQNSEVNAAQASGMKAAQDPAIELPSDACTQEGYWSFFEAFVKSSKIRQTYTDNNVIDAINPFRIALVEHQWVYVEAHQKPGRETLSLKETHRGDRFRVEFARAELGPDDEVVKTHGKPGVYEFQFKAGCWRLTNSIQ